MNAQTTATENQTITVNLNDLPENVKQDLLKKQKIQEVKDVANTAAEVAKDARSIGHEIGVAVDEALGAVTKHATAFGKTDVGRFTMAMVFLAIMKDQLPVFYKTILGTLFGIPFIIFVNVMLFILYFRTTRQYKRVKGFAEDNKTPLYEYVDTWYTSGTTTADATGRSVFNAIFFIGTILSNIFIIAGVIF